MPSARQAMSFRSPTVHCGEAGREKGVTRSLWQVGRTCECPPHPATTPRKTPHTHNPLNKLVSGLAPSTASRPRCHVAHIEPDTHARDKPLTKGLAPSTASRSPWPPPGAAITRKCIWCASSCSRLPAVWYSRRTSGPLQPYLLRGVEWRRRGTPVSHSLHGPAHNASTWPLRRHTSACSPGPLPVRLSTQPAAQQAADHVQQALCWFAQHPAGCPTGSWPRRRMPTARLTSL